MWSRARRVAHRRCRRLVIVVGGACGVHVLAKVGRLQHCLTRQFAGARAALRSTIITPSLPWTLR